MPKTQEDHKTEHIQTAASIVWFEIPADNPERAKKFYGTLFGWKIEKFPEAEDYWHIDTGGADETPDGGLMVRKYSQQPITNYITVPSIDESTGRSNNSAARSANRKPLFRRWATSWCVRTQKAMSSRCGR